MFYLTTHSTHFIYSYMASDIWLRTILIVRKERKENVLFIDTLNTFYLQLYGILIVRKETRCHDIGYSFRLTARVLLYAPSFFSKPVFGQSLVIEDIFLSSF